MLSTFRWLFRIATALVVLAVVVVVGVYYFLSRSLPDYDTTWRVRGISADVEIARNTWAVPHIFGQSDADVFFGLGFAHAQDRLWQMARQIGRRGYRGTDVTVVFERPDGTRATVRRRGPRTVILRGEPSELLLHAFGRDEVRVETTGPAADVAEVAASGRGI